MLKYKKLNVNPKGRVTGDCSTRALVSVLGISYDEALRLQTSWSLKTYYDPTSKFVMDKLLGQYGYVKMKQPKKANNKKYLVGELDGVITEAMRNKGVLVSVSHHLTAIKGDEVIDIWDCRYKTVCNYWVKVN